MEALQRNASVRLFGVTTRLSVRHGQICGVGQRRWFFWVKNFGARITSFWHNPKLQMTKTELQSALAEATQTDKRIAGVFLDTLSDIATANLSCPVLSNS